MRQYILDFFTILGVILPMYTYLVSSQKRSQIHAVFYNWIEKYKNFSIIFISQNITKTILSIYNKIYGSKVNDSFFTKQSLIVSLLVSIIILLFSLYQSDFLTVNLKSVLTISIFIQLPLIIYYGINTKNKTNYLSLSFIFSIYSLIFIYATFIFQFYKFELFLNIFICYSLSFSLISLYKLNLYDIAKYFLMYFLLTFIIYVLFTSIDILLFTNTFTPLTIILSVILLFVVMKYNYSFKVVIIIFTISIFLVFYLLISDDIFFTKLEFNLTIITYYLAFLFIILTWMIMDFISINATRYLFDIIIKEKSFLNLLKYILLDICIVIFVFLIPSIVIMLIKLFPELISYTIQFNDNTLDDIIVFQLLHYDKYIIEFLVSLLSFDELKWNNILLINLYILIPTMLHLICIFIYLAFIILNSTINRLLCRIHSYLAIEFNGLQKMSWLISFIISVTLFILL